MTNHKYTDEEVIRALEFCRDNERNDTCEYCPKCPAAYWELDEDGGEGDCIDSMLTRAIALINRQRVEIEKWQLAYDCADSALRELSVTRSEAIKEFVERLKEKMKDLSRMEYGGKPYFLVSNSFIDQTAKEMTEGKPCTDSADCSTCEHCYHDGGYNECATDGWK